MNKVINQNNIKQFLSYFCVGGIAAIVEWVMFTVFANIMQINYLNATILAFVFSTSTNWLLGRMWTFKNNEKYKNNVFREGVLIFIVCAVGLLFNILLMYLFVTILEWGSPLLKCISKILATGIVFIWNYCVRKLIIYR